MTTPADDPTLGEVLALAPEEREALRVQVLEAWTARAEQLAAELRAATTSRSDGMRRLSKESQAAVWRVQALSDMPSWLNWLKRHRP